VTASATAAVVTLGVFLAFPHAFGRAGQASPAASGQPATPQPTATSRPPKVAPAAFTPFSLPVRFGWLPAGYSQDGTAVSRWLIDARASRPGYQNIILIVFPRSNGFEDLGKVTGPAPDVDGRPAWWLSGGGLEWEYAPGGWAAIGVDMLGMTSGGRSLPPSQQEQDYQKIAEGLVWKAQPILFPFKLTHALPAGWTVQNVAAAYDGKYLIASDGISAAPASDAFTGDEDLTIGASHTPLSQETDLCEVGSPVPRYTTADGVSWEIVHQSPPDGSSGGSLADAAPVDRACAQSLVDGLAASIAFYPEGLGGGTSDLPGAAELGSNGAATVLSWLRFLGPSPAGWTDDPLAP
jgi:hypothetical protein